MNNFLYSNSTADILVVDDAPENLRLLKDLLTSQGYKVRPASSGEDALEAVDQRKPDLILLDIKMPGMDGFELCRQLKQDTRIVDVPILFISASLDIKDQVRCFQEGGLDFISKPIRQEEVLARVETHLELYKVKQNLEALVDQRTEELRKSEALFRGVFENAGVGIVYLDADKKIAEANDFFLNLFAYDAESLRGSALTDLIYLDDREITIDYLERLMKMEIEAVQFEARFIPKGDGFRWGNFFIGSLHDENHCTTGFSIVLEDITTGKKLEEERDKSEKHLRESHMRLRELSSHLQHVREEEKKHIAREIHDEMGGTLTAIKLDAAWVKKKLGKQPQELTEKVGNLVGTIDSVIATTRRIVTELRPTLIDDLGIWAAVEWQVKEFEQRTGIACVLKNACDSCLYLNSCENTLFTQQISITLYRILQEALTNIARYASASQVNVGCRTSNGTVTFTIKDNGIGFDKRLIEKPGAHGIRGMYERAESVGGHLLVESEKDNGTRIAISLPMNGKEDHG